MGSTQALATEALPTDLGTLSPTVQEQTSFYSAGSFSDIFNFSVGADQHTFVGSAANWTPEGYAADATHVSSLTLTLYSDVGGTGAVVGQVSSTNGAAIDLSGILAQGDYSVQISGLADGTLGGGYQLSVLAVPEPAEWMMLLAGLMVVTFVARRKTRLVTAIG